MKCRGCETELGVRKFRGVRRGRSVVEAYCEVCHKVDFPRSTPVNPHEPEADQGDGDGVLERVPEPTMVLTMEGLRPKSAQAD